jgi:uncharacterized membrane protein YtjA (UPF0391 family)
LKPCQTTLFSRGIDPIAVQVLKAYVWASKNKGTNMLYYTVVFLVVALIAGFLGFASLAGLAAEIAKIFFLVFVVLFVVALVSGRSPRN